MRKSLLVILMAVCLVFTLSPAVLAKDDGFDPLKEWEYNLSVGYMGFKDKTIDDSAYLSVRAMKRIGYPFLVGMSATGAFIGNVAYVELGVPVAMRVDTGISSIKADVIAIPGLVFARNSDTKLSKVAGSATAGMELKKFVMNGTSVGLGAYYTIHTYSKLNSVKLAFVVAF